MRKTYNILPKIPITSWVKMEMEEIARWAYIVFVIIAIVAGLAVGYMAYDAGSWNDPNVADINGYVLIIMLILGVIIGVTSITAREVTPFLIATIALVVAANANVWPAAVIIAVKGVFAMAKEA